jgi:hypothetical protein
VALRLKECRSKGSLKVQIKGLMAQILKGGGLKGGL